MHQIRLFRTVSLHPYNVKEQTAVTAQMRPAHAWYLCKYYQFVFTIHNQKQNRWNRNQTDRKANKENEVFSILFRSKLYSNPSAYARVTWRRRTVHNMQHVRCTRYIRFFDIPVSMFNLRAFHLFISMFFFFHYRHLQCCWMFDAFFVISCSSSIASSSSSSFVSCFWLSFDVRCLVVGTTRQSSLGKCWKKCNWFDQLFNLANCVRISFVSLSLSLSRRPPLTWQ